MKVNVLMSSGDEDEWEDISGAEVDMGLGGALVLTVEGAVAAIYAAGMWMKLEHHD